MEFFKPGITYDFFKYRWPCIITSTVLTVASLISLFWPGPRFGIDFKGGTEVELQFKGDVTPNDLRAAVAELGFGAPDVISVQDEKNHYLLRLDQISSLTPEQIAAARKRLDQAVGEGQLIELKPSPGGDMISLSFAQYVDPAKIQQELSAAGLKVREVAPFGNASEARYEVFLIGIGEKLVQGLQDKLGARAPERPLRVEWVGPKAGQQLREAAAKSILYAIAFIMVYVGFRFDLRFAPGGVLALMHDALITVGVYVLLQKEVTLATIAAVLTVIGFSINDTIVIYDRIRENLQRMRDASFAQVINVSTSQTLGRTIITSGTALVSVIGFFIWGTPMIRDIVFALAVGFTVGSYSTIFVAAPLTEWMDRRFFRRISAR
jgi:preprotein translocase subunit SecF